MGEYSAARRQFNRKSRTAISCQLLRLSADAWRGPARSGRPYKTRFVQSVQSLEVQRAPDSGALTHSLIPVPEIVQSIV
jgi:hypothetical protein